MHRFSLRYVTKRSTCLGVRAEEYRTQCDNEQRLADPSCIRNRSRYSRDQILIAVAQGEGLAKYAIIIRYLSEYHIVTIMEPPNRSHDGHRVTFRLFHYLLIRRRRRGHDVFIIGLDIKLSPH